MEHQTPDPTKTVYTSQEARMMILFGFTLYGKVWNTDPADTSNIVYQQGDYTLYQSDILEINTVEKLDWILDLWTNNKLIFYPFMFSIKLNKRRELNLHIEEFNTSIDFVRDFPLTVENVPRMLKYKERISNHSYTLLTSLR